MNESLIEIEKVFMAFADKTRLRLLFLMRNGEVSVNYLCESLETSQPKVSRHLAYLRSMDIVHTRRDGKWIFYSLNIPASRMGSQLLKDTLAWVGNSAELATAYEPSRSERTSLAEETPRATHNTYAETHTSRNTGELEIYLL